MEYRHIAHVYDYVVRAAPDKGKFLGEIAWAADVPNMRPADIALYNPFYSARISAGIIHPRIRFLQDGGYDVFWFGKQNAEDMEALANRLLPGGGKFGYVNRLEDMRLRAVSILSYGVEALEKLLTPPARWTSVDLIVPTHVLQEMRWVGQAAAFHVLMDMQWGVVKPDIHICRFLHRIDASWRDFIKISGESAVVNKKKIHLFQEKWRNCSDAIIAESARRQDASFEIEGHRFPPIKDMKSRQFDILIMNFSQTVNPRDADWKPVPLCTLHPACSTCGMTGCVS